VLIADVPTTRAAAPQAGGAGTVQPSDPLGQALQVLDQVLTLAVEAQAQVLGPASLLDPWRGLHLDAADVKRLLGGSTLKGEPGVADTLAAAALRVPQLASAAQWLRLTSFDLAVSLVVLAPDVDLRYERLYGYLQDDLSRRRPTLDLLARLLSPSVAERQSLLQRFDDNAPLVAQGLVEPVDEGAATSWLARTWRLRPMWLHWLLGQEGLRGPLQGSAHLLPSATVALDLCVAEADTVDLLGQRIAQAQHTNRPLRVALQGPHGSGKFVLAQALSSALGMSLLVIDVRGWISPSEWPAWMREVRCAASLCNALPYLHGVDALGRQSPQALRALMDGLAGPRGWFVLSTTQAMPPLHAQSLHVLRVAMTLPTADRRERLWKRALTRHALPADEGAVRDVSGRFALSAAQIEQAVADLAESAPPSDLQSKKTADYPRLAAVARRQSGAALASLAQRIEPKASFNTLVTAPEVLAQLREMSQRMAAREQVRRDWGGHSVHARSVGVSALFAGPSGTGKTLAVEAVAFELGLDLVRIDLATVVSKYIGETEKNLDAVFTAAESANAVLFFDEADALFGKRSEVKDAHDRYANLEVAYLLQRMEQFDGLAVLATNLRQNLDEAFTRRLTFCINFPFPEAQERKLLWEQLWPPKAPRADDVDLAFLAREHRLSGGNIRNAVLAAAHLAVGEGQAIHQRHLAHAIRREFQKMGRTVVDAVGGAR
jgi:SpoVK/Ycf46/Vps4 family AAA+-type ATPase